MTGDGRAGQRAASPCHSALIEEEPTMRSETPQPIPEMPSGGPAYAPAPPPAQPGAPYYVGPMAISTNPLAIASLACSVGSWLVLPVIGALLGVIFGHIALGQIRRSNGTQDGHGMAVAGLVVGYVHLAIVPIVILLFILFFAGMIGAASLSSFVVPA